MTRASIHTGVTFGVSSSNQQYIGEFGGSQRDVEFSDYQCYESERSPAPSKARVERMAC